MHKLDDVFSSLGFDGLDLIKMDVEGYELDVLEGAMSVLASYRPIVLLEMNHVALNLWRGISLPEFRLRLLNIFPFVYAVQNGTFLDLRDDRQSHSVLFSHLTNFHYMDVVAGFDKLELIARLERIPEISQRNEDFELNRNTLLAAQQIIASQQEELNAVVTKNNELLQQLSLLQDHIGAIRASHSWKITAPLRYLKRLISN